MTAKHTMTLMSWTEPVWPVWLRTKEPSITIVLDDLYVHDVDGNVYNKHMANGGIYFNRRETG